MCRDAHEPQHYECSPVFVGESVSGGVNRNWLILLPFELNRILADPYRLASIAAVTVQSGHQVLTISRQNHRF